MDDNKIKYRKYLDEIFQEDDDFYYINLSTKEIYPQYKVIDKLRKVESDAAYEYLNLDGVLSDLSGRPLLCFKPDDLKAVSKNIVACSKEEKFYLIDINDGRIIYQTTNGFTADSFTNGYFLLEATTTFFATESLRSELGHIYLLINPKGQVIDKQKIKNLGHKCHVEMVNNKVSVVLNKEDFIYKGPRLSEDKDPVITEKIGKFYDYVEDILGKFNVSKEIRKEIIKKVDAQEYEYIVYNNSFLRFYGYKFLYDDDKIEFVRYYLESQIIICKNGQILKKSSNVKIIPKYDKHKPAVNFNKDAINIYENNGYSFYDKNGVLISRYLKSDNMLKVDRIFAKLFQKEVFTALKQEKNYLQFMCHGKTFYTNSNYSCNRLLIKSQTGKYGFLDEFGNEVIKPIYVLASDFIDGMAKVKKLEKSNSIFYIDIFGSETKQLDKTNLSYYLGNQLSIYQKSDFKPCDYLFYTSKKLGVFTIYTYFDYRTKLYKKTYYKPIRQYQNYMLYLNDWNYAQELGYYLFDKDTNKSYYLGAKDSIISCCDDYFVINNKTFFVKDKLIALENYSLLHRCLNESATLLSLEEYIASISKEEEPVFSKSKMRPEEIKVNLENKQKKLAQLLQQRSEYEQALRQLDAQIHNIKMLHALPVPPDFCLEINDMKIISPEYLKDLIYFDLLTYDFTSFYVSGIDFSGTNACLDPQKVYNKDMRNGNYSDVTILNYDMTGVNIENSIFTNDFINCYQENMLKLKRNNQ